MVPRDQVHVAFFQTGGADGRPEGLLGLMAQEGWQVTAFDQPDEIVNGVQSGQFHLAVVASRDPATLPEQALHTLMGLQIDTPLMVLVPDPKEAQRQAPALAEAINDQLFSLDGDPGPIMEAFRREVRSAVLSQPEYEIICVDDDREFLSSLEEFLPARLAKAFPRFTLNLDFHDSPAAALEAVTRISTGQGETADGVPASSSREALAIVVSDQIMPTMKGIELLAHVKKASPTTLRVLLTGQAGLPVAVEGINNQILDKFLTKPIEEPTGFVNTLKHLIQEHHLRLRSQWHRQRVVAQFDFIQTISASRQVDEAVTAAVRFLEAHTRARRIVALIRGEDDFFTVRADSEVPSAKCQVPNSDSSFGTRHSTLGTSYSKVRLPSSTPLLDWIVAHQTSVVAATAEELPAPLPVELEGRLVFPLVAMPLVWGGNVLGLLLVSGSGSSGFTRDDTMMIRFAAETVGVVVGGLQDRLALEHYYVATMSSLMEAVEAKDRYTAGHTSRVMHYALDLARAVGVEGKALRDLEFAAALHDIGKIAVPDQIITKPGKLTDEEFEQMKQHPGTGDHMLRHLTFLRSSRMILRAHHERYDGRGYLDHLTGEEIPLGARILAIADSFDAMTSDRSYRQAMSVETALREIEAKAGTQFDPRLAAMFTRNMRVAQGQQKVATR